VGQIGTQLGVRDCFFFSFFFVTNERLEAETSQEREEMSVD